ncbi:MAG: hypothetical protein P0S95_03025 [Rhabdochlamydiaceae bacterium]|nr:hypothetical protein [Candidatus Amphrikana amoebophyrae]
MALFIRGGGLITGKIDALGPRNLEGLRYKLTTAEGAEAAILVVSELGNRELLDSSQRSLCSREMSSIYKGGFGFLTGYRTQNFRVELYLIG